MKILGVPLLVTTVCIFTSVTSFADIKCLSHYEGTSRKAMISIFKNAMKDPLMVPHLQDSRNFVQIEQIKMQGAVSLVVGNSTKINRGDNLKIYTELAKTIAESGRIVLYDADASTAHLIKDAAGGRAVGISALRSSNSPGNIIFKIENMNMRMDAFGENTTVVASNDSLVGMGLLIHRKVNHVIDTDGSWNNQLIKWNQTLENDHRNLGIKYKPVSSIKHAGDLQLSKIENNKDVAVKSLSQISKDDISAMLDHAHAIVDAEKNGVGSDGAVIFGSAKIDKYSAASVYEISYALGSHGIDGTTGGAGGAMWLSNAGFFDAGARSIGIPIVGRNQLALETRVPTKVQSTTVGVQNYHQRVYELLNNRKFVGFVPGGSGTMRELGATMVMMAPNPSKDVLMGFVDTHYYKELVDFLTTQPLPRAFKNRILADVTLESIPRLAQTLKSMGMKTPAIVVPRNSGGKFEPTRFTEASMTSEN